MTETVTTEQAITGGGIRSVNFFNGRLLTGEDLTREQQANQLGRLRLGRAVGDGVARGLEVAVAASTSNARPVVRVEAGLAVSRSGRVLELAGATDVSLASERAGRPGRDVLFADCAPLQPATYSAGAGTYLLTIAPAQSADGRAPVSGLGNEGAACASAFSIEGVQFHLLRIALPPALLEAPELLRSRLAHLLLGTDDARRRGMDVDPLRSSGGPYGLLDDLRAARCIDDEHVPLAVLAWTAAHGIRFVDEWSVRRRIVAPAADARFGKLLGDRREAEAEAVLLQFQAQVAELRPFGPIRRPVTAADQFAFLPPAGMVPLADSSAQAGFDVDAFLGTQGSDELATIDAARVRALLRESLAHEPIEVGGGGERIQRYVIWENENLAVRGVPRRRVLVFASAALSYRGAARFSHARHGRSRFAPRVI